MEKQFRFQDLRIWQLAIEIASDLFDIADGLEKKRLYRFAEQLRGAGMSMSNNIAEGSGSVSKKDFNQFLNIAHRSTFENANILILLERRAHNFQRNSWSAVREIGNPLSTDKKFSESLGMNDS